MHHGRSYRYSCTSQVKQISSKIPMMAPHAQVWDPVSSKAFPFLDQTQNSAWHRRQSVSINPVYKGVEYTLQRMWFCVQRQGI